MNEKLYWEGGCLLAPVPPAMVSCGSVEKPNIITIAWTGILNSKPPMTYISVRPERHSFDIIKESGEFVINLTPKSLLRACDWCGVKSGKDFDKFKEMNLTPIVGKNVSTPIIAEAPISLECKVKDIIPLGSHYMFIADIVGIQVDKSLVDEKGKLDIMKADLLSYAHGQYISLDETVGTFGYSVRKKA